MSQSVEYPIVNGPSKWDLMLALFGRKDGNVPLVSFSFDQIPLSGTTGDWQLLFPGDIGNGSILAGAHILGVHANDHYGESWMLHAHIYVPFRGEEVCFLAIIYFRTDTRKGNVRFVPMS